MNLLLVAALIATPGPDSATESTADSARQLASRVCVRVMNGERGENGSGVVVAQRGAFLYVLSAAHVVKGAKQVEIRLPAVNKQPAMTLRDVDVLADAPLQDLALLRVPVSSAAVPTVVFAEKLASGDEPFEGLSAGYALQNDIEVRREQVLRLKGLRHKDGEVTLVWECRDRPNSGRSGGPLLDRDGRLIGICSGTQDGRGYYCHLDEIRAWLKKRNFAWIMEAKSEKGAK